MPATDSAARGAPARDSFARLERDVVACRLCPRLLRHCREIARVKRRAYRDEDYWGRPVPGFGDPQARVLVLGLAPGAHGANRTGRMFTGDASGDWLFRALHETGFANRAASTGREDGLRLRGAWITAAGRCAPPDNKPAPDELARCRRHLLRETALLPDVRLVVALGGIAFDAYLAAVRETGGAVPRPKPKFAHGAWVEMGEGEGEPGARAPARAAALRWPVLCSYHPSRQNTQTGRLTRPMLLDVFRRARAAAWGGR